MAIAYQRVTYLRKLVLLLRWEIDVPEEQGVVLHDVLISEVLYRTSESNTNLVQQPLDLFEFLVRQSPGVDAPDLSSKVLKFGRVGGGREGKRDGFDGHCGFEGDILGEIRTRVQAYVVLPRSVESRRGPIHFGRNGPHARPLLHQPGPRIL